MRGAPAGGDGAALNDPGCAAPRRRAIAHFPSLLLAAGRPPSLHSARWPAARRTPSGWARNGTERGATLPRWACAARPGRAARRTEGRSARHQQRTRAAPNGRRHDRGLVRLAPTASTATGDRGRAPHRRRASDRGTKPTTSRRGGQHQPTSRRGAGRGTTEPTNQPHGAGRHGRAWLPPGAGAPPGRHGTSGAAGQPSSSIPPEHHDRSITYLPWH